MVVLPPFSIFSPKDLQFRFGLVAPGRKTHREGVERAMKSWNQVNLI